MTTNHQRLESFRDLETGWCGDGAKSIDPLVIESAGWLMGRIPAELEATAAVFPTGDGKIMVEWRSPDRTLELDLEFTSPHDVEASLWRYPDIECIADPTFNLAMNLQEITDLIRRTLETDA